MGADSIIGRCWCWARAPPQLPRPGRTNRGDVRTGPLPPPRYDGLRLLVVPGLDVGDDGQG